MNVLIIANFAGDMDGSGNNRFTYIASALSKKGHKVKMVTSDYNHENKKARRNVNCKDFKIKLIHEPGYKKNVCLKRFYSHYIWGRNIYKYLKKQKNIDVVYCAVPSLTAPSKVSMYCKKSDIKFIIDIQDLWPEAFKMVFHVPVLSDIIFKPFEMTANKIYRNADAIVAVSDTYVKRAMKVNKKCKNGQTVFLGTRISDFDKNVEENPVNKIMYDAFAAKEQGEEKKIFLAYCGTLGSSYDLTCVIDALSLVKRIGLIPPKFVVMGDGPRREAFEEYAKSKDVDTLFTGRLPYAEMCGMLAACDITVNPITKGAAQSIINKHADYAACGLPVINTQECEEYRKLVESYNMGFNCKNNDAEDLAKKIILLIKDAKLREEMGKNSRRCAVEMFDREISYKNLLDLITNV